MTIGYYLYTYNWLMSRLLQAASICVAPYPLLTLFSYETPLKNPGPPAFP